MKEVLLFVGVAILVVITVTLFLTDLPRQTVVRSGGLIVVNPRIGPSYYIDTDNRLCFASEDGGLTQIDADACHRLHLKYIGVEEVGEAGY